MATLQANAASTAMEAYHKAAAAHLHSARQAVRSLAEQGSRDDVPTGRTPRKRAWEYVDEWELTKPRDTVIKSWRGKEAPNVESQTFLAEHPPLQEDKERRGEIAGEIATPIPPEPVKVGEIHPAPEHVKVGDREPSPPFSPLDSSASSSSSIPIPPPILVRKKTGTGRSGLPTMGTLTDQATNIGTGRRTRRVR
jgi:kinesin family member 11